MFSLVTSQSPNFAPAGGMRTVAITIVKLIGKERVKLVERDTLRHYLTTIYFCKHPMILLGYADKAAYLSFWRILLFPHSVIYLPAFHPSSTMRRSRLAKLYEKFIFPRFLRARSVICLSHWEREYFLSLYPKCNALFFRHPINQPSSRHLRKSRTKLLFVGRNDENKNLLGFLQFASSILLELPDLEVCVVTNHFSGIPDRYFEDPKFFFETDASAERLEGLYLESLAVIIPSRWESLSLVALEAAARGCKVVVNGNVRVYDDCGQFSTLFLDSYDDIARTITFLTQQFCEAEVKVVQSKYSFDAGKAAMVEFLGENVDA